MGLALKSILRSLGVGTDNQCDYVPNVSTFLAAVRLIAPPADRGSFAFRNPDGS
jgi:hypothetical protein